jgi:hypothetical protein
LTGFYKLLVLLCLFFVLWFISSKMEAGSCFSSIQ